VLTMSLVGNDPRRTKVPSANNALCLQMLPFGSLYRQMSDPDEAAPGIAPGSLRLGSACDGGKMAALQPCALVEAANSSHEEKVVRRVCHQLFQADAAKGDRTGAKADHRVVPHLGE
jgi:hypothetical protein